MDSGFETMVPAPETGRLITDQRADFRQDFNSASFAFQHSLAAHPLFELQRLARLAEAILERGDPQKFVVLGKPVGAGSKFSDMAPRERLADTIRGLDRAGSWLKLSHAHDADPEYQHFLDQAINELEERTGLALRGEITLSILTIFLASPNVVTPYHMDHETNFLFQVRGEKDVCLFDQNDREVVSEVEIERFYAGNPEAANYRPDLQDRGRIFHLTPGRAVHHPPLSPHWVKNGENISISVSMGFCMRGLETRARVWQANHVLRRLGLRPTPPGVAPGRDRVKSATLKLLSKDAPRNREELLFSGFRRLAAPLQVVKRLRGRA
jgi:hypothetical protein